ncbi:MAG TPA: DUF3810 family protein [Vicinamibacterales bacterium]|nr:DUF3810 family protein [Vicinamibacterales bacterium]
MNAPSYSLNPEPVRWWVVSLVVAVIVFFTPLPAWVIEDFYSRDMYPWLQDIVTTVTNTLPLAVLDVILIVVAFAVLFRIRRLYYVLRQRGVMDAIWEAFRRIVRAVCVLAVLFYWAWGFNYRRVPLESIIPGGKSPQVTVDMLVSGFSDSAVLAASLRRMVANDAGNLHTIRLELVEPMNLALKSLGRIPLETPSVPKFSLVLTPFFRSSGVTGMINPFGLETIVFPDLLPFERPFVVAHEWAHLAGQADEAEASAVGWLACMKGDAVVAYSASLYLIMETARAMPPDVREKAMARLDAGVRQDIDAIVERMTAQSPRVQETTSRVYDEYLKANRVEDGTASYGRALSFILSPPFRDALSNYTLTR